MDNKGIDEIKVDLSIWKPDWQILTAKSVKECMDIINSTCSPDMVIVSMHLSSMCGLDLIQRIRDDSDIPIVLLLQNEDSSRVQEIFDIGANDYFILPLSVPLLIARLEALLRRRKWDIKIKKEKQRK